MDVAPGNSPTAESADTDRRIIAHLNFARAVAARSHQLYGAPVSHILNSNATWPWPDELPLVTDG